MDQQGAIITLHGGAYRLRERLACSAYGVLWRADAPGCGAQVALKLVNRGQMARAAPGQRRRWVDSAASEIAFLASLAPWDQRHIVRLLDNGTHHGLPAAALELLGVDLGRHLAACRAAGRGVPFAQVVDWIAQANQSIAKVHQYGWRYLDLKPGNLLLDPAGHCIKLADFGTCLHLRDGSHGYTGTARWQAPEQFFPVSGNRYDTDARTDYFALGALLYFLACGQPLRFGTACADAFREHGSAGAAHLLARHGGSIPPTLGQDEAARFASHAGAAQGPALELLRTLLAPRREQRPSHALDISRHIARIRAALVAPNPGMLRSAA